MQIVADKPTNSLIITARPEELDSIINVIKKLDIIQSQVLVEALIMEVSTDYLKGVGVEWRLMEQPVEGSLRGYGGTNLPTTGDMGYLNQMAKNPFNPPPGLAIGIIKGKIIFNGVEYMNLGALIQAVQKDSNVNILLTPHILTLNHEEAEIVVGEERPYLKSSQTTDTGSTIKTYEFKDVGIILRLTPHITKERLVKLDIYQEIKDFVSEIDIGAITTTVRQAKTSVLVEDNSTVVIGGLIKNNFKSRETKVPKLAKIPIFGWLFKSKNKENNKTNLLIFITPHIINEPSQAIDLTNQMKNKIKLK